MQPPVPIHIVYQAIVFLFVLTVLSKFVFRPILKVFSEREARMSGDKEEARQLVKQANQQIQDYEEKIYSAKSDAKDLKNQILTDAGKKEREILNQAREESSNIIADARQKMKKEADDLIPQIQKDSEEIAKEMASMVLGRGAA